jgi:DNA-binding transcriptional LysR family regulator
MKDPLRHASLKQLKIFAIAVEQQSFARAAEILHLSQPAVSMQMSRLAEGVGLELFEKSGRNQRVTRAGEILYPYVKQVTQTLREAGEELDALKGARHGKIKVAMVTTSRYFAPKLVARFCELNPDIEIDFTIANRQTVIEKLENNQIDLAIMGRPPSRLGVVAEAFAEHPYVIIAAPDYPLVGKRRFSAQKLAGETFLAREAGSGTRMLMEHFFAENGIEVPVLQEVPSNESIKQAVMAGMGLALISKHTIGLEYQTGNITILNVRDMPILRTWYVLHLEGKSVNPIISAFKAFMLEQAPGFISDLFGK